MAKETQPKPAEPAPAAEVVPAEASTETKPEEEAKKPTEEQPPASEAEPAAAAAEEEEKKPTEETAEEVTEEAAAAVAEEVGVTQSASFKEESNIVSDLQDPEKKALDELKQLIQAALANKEFTPPPPPPPPLAVEEALAGKEEGKKTEEANPEEKTEEVKTEEKTEEVKKEETKEVKTEEASVSTPEAAPPSAEVPLKAEKLAPAAKDEETSPPLPAAEVTEDKAVIVNEDGALTVETIEETVVPVATPPEVTPAAEEPASAVTEETATPAAEEPASAVTEETATPAAAETEAAEAPTSASAEPAEEVFIWGVPLIGDEKSDTVLLKFLRARDFKVKDSLIMIKNAVIWRKQFGIDSLVEEDLEIPELEKVVFNHGFDKEGHPVCYNVYGEFQNKELYGKAFGDEEKREKFLRWRIQFLEKGIRQLLDFSPGGVSYMVQVTDLKNTVGPGKKELRVATKKALNLLQDNYPEFAAKQIFINVPWWYLAYNRFISSIFTPRSKSKFVFAGPSKSAETLFKYIAPEQVPVQYGGLSKENDPDFTTADAVTEVTIKPASKNTIEIPATEGSVLVWELRVLGWEVSYGAEFIPSAEDGYTVIVQKARKFVPTDEPYVKNSFKTGEAGKVVLTIDNATSKKKKLLYRYKEKSSTESS